MLRVAQINIYVLYIQFYRLALKIIASVVSLIPAAASLRYSRLIKIYKLRHARKKAFYNLTKEYDLSRHPNTISYGPAHAAFSIIISRFQDCLAVTT